MINFLHPFGLIGLIGIPIIIIIYLIKNKYNEKVISSTYIWNLSEKFLKKKNPIHKINGLLSLILQIISITILSLCIARPIISIKDNAKNYMFILDSSLSMSMKSDGGTTRFNRAKEKIKEIVKNSKNGSYYSLIYANDNSSLLIDKTTSKETLYNSLTNLITTNSSSLDNAMSLMQQYYSEDSSYDAYVLTDKDYINTNNVTIINVSNNEINSAIISLKVVYDINNNINVYGNVITYGGDLKVKISLSIDDKKIEELNIDTYKENEIEFVFKTNALEYNKIEAKIENDDALSEDNSYILYNNESTNSFKALIVSKQPTFLRNILKVLGNKAISVISPSEYSVEDKGYSLYIFDAYTPAILPDDGSVWLFKANNNVAQGGFIVQNEVKLAQGGELSLKNEASSTYKSLTKSIVGKNIFVSKYQKYTLYSDATILFTYNNDPMVFALLNNYNNREVVFSFDLHDSNFPLSLDFVPLFQNLIKYSIPDFLEKSNYSINETLNVNVLPFTKSIRVNMPNNMSKLLDISTNIASLALTEIGTYKIVANVNGADKDFYIFVQSDLNESKTNEVIDSISLEGKSNNKNYDEKYDGLLMLIAFALFVFLFDWGVYIYEQH